MIRPESHPTHKSRRPRFQSLRIKATLIMTLGAAIMLSLMAAGTDLQISRVEQDRVMSETQMAGARVSDAVREHALSGMIPAFGAVNAIQVVDGDRHVLDSSQTLAGRPAISDRMPTAKHRIQQYTQCGRDGCFAMSAIRVSTEPGSPVVYAACPLPPMLTTGWLESLITAAVVVLTALVAAATWWLVGRRLRPVEAIRSRLEEISDADAGLGVPLPPGNDEIAHLAATTNATLERLSQAVIRQRQFASDAAHELRTPLAALRVHLEEALLFPDADPHAALREALAGADRLEKVLTDLLLLTKLGSGSALSIQLIDLTGLVYAQVAHCSRVPVRTDLEPGVTVSGVCADLTRLVGNLLDNAERHANTGVEVKLRRHESQAVLTVTDDGPGIPVQDRERIFERFARLDTARSRGAGGIGLGLTIARHIATLHHGTLVIEDSPSGARFVLRLPSTDGQADGDHPAPTPADVGDERAVAEWHGCG